MTSPEPVLTRFIAALTRLIAHPFLNALNADYDKMNPLGGTTWGDSARMTFSIIPLIHRRCVGGAVCYI